MIPNELKQKVAEWIREQMAKPLPWWVQVLMVCSKSLVLGGVISSLVVFVCEFGTYYYCICCEDVRPPVEGIPFFRLTLFYLSFVTWILFHIVSWVLVAQINWWVSRTAIERKRKDYQEAIEEFGKGTAVAIEFGVPIVFSYLVGIAISYFHSVGGMNVLLSASVYALLLWLALTVNNGVALIWPKVRTYARPIAGFLLSLWFLFGVFHKDNFASLLQMLKYGGRIPVVVEYEKSGGANEPKSVTGQLIIRSSKALIIDKSSESSVREIEEVNLAYVRRIEYLSKHRTQREGTGKKKSD